MWGSSPITFAFSPHDDSSGVCLHICQIKEVRVAPLWRVRHRRWTQANPRVSVVQAIGSRQAHIDGRISHGAH
jgi:hypothetical protein